MLSDRGERAEARLKDSPYDLEAWNILIKENQLRTIEDARPFYERLVERFPVTGRFWKLYIEHEMKHKNYDKVEKLFQRSLTKVLHIDLWRSYLNYVKETKGNLTSFREKMAKAYDFALDKIGADFQSGPIWNDYVNFLKNVDAVGSYAENQKITAVRKVYQRGVVNPMSAIEAFWNDYTVYEKGVNQIIADKMINDRSRDYMNARRVTKEYEVVSRGLNRNAPSLPPGTNAESEKQVELWRKFIAWEKANPLRIEDASEVVRRVEFAYEQALLCLGHHPDVWYEYASYLEEAAKANEDKGDSKKYLDDAAGVYERATGTLLKSNILLHFAWADFEEGRNRKEKASTIYSDLLEIKELDPTLVYVQYMKFSRRAEGIKNARQIFKRAREDVRSGHHVFSASALMEYYCSKDKNVACKIFELGLKKYQADAGYVLSYIDFLSHLNEENNTRVLFERVLTSGALAIEDQLEVWNKFLEFESNIGDLSSITKVEKRRTAAVERVSSKISETAWLVDRYKFQDLFPCSPTELRAIGYNVSAQTTGALVTNGNGAAPKTSSDQETSRTTGIPRPDFRQMVAFKPMKDAKLPYANYRINGGVFPPPPSVSYLLSILPHPQCFRGPFVQVDQLMALLKDSIVPGDLAARPPRVEPPKNGDAFFATARAAANGFGSNASPGQEATRQGSKRSFNFDDDDDGEGGDNSNSNPPAFDIYRSRQIQKRK